MSDKSEELKKFDDIPTVSNEENKNEEVLKT